MIRRKTAGAAAATGMAAPGAGMAAAALEGT